MGYLIKYENNEIKSYSDLFSEKDMIIFNREFKDKIEGLLTFGFDLSSVTFFIKEENIDIPSNFDSKKSSYFIYSKKEEDYAFYFPTSKCMHVIAGIISVVSHFIESFNLNKEGVLFKVDLSNLFYYLYQGLDSEYALESKKMLNEKNFLPIEKSIEFCLLYYSEDIINMSLKSNQEFLMKKEDFNYRLISHINFFKETNKSNEGKLKTILNNCFFHNEHRNIETIFKYGLTDWIFFFLENKDFYIALQNMDKDILKYWESQKNCKKYTKIIKNKLAFENF